ncbi:hypothetical protein [Streptomyces sp. RerS4]|uniref:hypothetical protein n=1 Tax=Streptomyces sp. RerS4 TaxID=2942449 RepID=UPI00201BFFF1|nr:hypothetical protein [Streptomyces sp. RerS4]UQX00117.1 hypothetical protein M4D82_05850 [Streptomyces sp. RerS4]
MWPGQQQPPGGEQNPQDAHQNPYQQQPGQAPNPYQQQPPQQGFGQQPGYGYPQAGYQTPPPVQPWGQPQQPPQPPGGRSPYATKTVAIVAASAVVVTAAVTGAFVLTRDDDKGAQANDKPPATAPMTPASSPPADAPSGNPRSGEAPKPVVPGWKVVINTKYGVAYDVPPEWNVNGSGVSLFFEDEAKGDGSPVITMSGTATLKSEWCAVDKDKDGDQEKFSLADTGVKGGQGAKDTAQLATDNTGSWVWAGFAQKEPKGTVKVTEPKEFTTSSGLKGHTVIATAPNVKKEHKCATDGKAVGFGFKNAVGDFASFTLITAAGVKEEVQADVYDKVLSSIRLSEG